MVISKGLEWVIIWDYASGASLITETLTSEGGSRRVGAGGMRTAAEVRACRAFG